ncbi:cupin domain-containing protein [Methylicorpusculum oleiharenae]|uniref:cupin domain-containing protein n=1 Tax=Methylicorpusculum oleiharenae TaxID=1338687 RepID=UPI00135A21A8|nr:cupin domain-containing protein [Methylicorpusculum oleiharenae]MCD2453731.1 cupin domain-containing protein [Methylicorpusculum oleiharenae]
MRIYLMALMLFFVDTALAQDKIDRMSAVTMESFNPDTVKWNDELLLPQGAQSVILVGDPKNAGVFIALLKFPSNYPIPPHIHPFTEVITVLRGKLGNGMGETFDTKKGEMLNVGSSFVLPGGHIHYVWTTDEETIVELIATGPWGITYTNPTEDPRKKK